MRQTDTSHKSSKYFTYYSSLPSDMHFFFLHGLWSVFDFVRFSRLFDFISPKEQGELNV